MGKYNYDSLKSSKEVNATSQEKKDYPRVGYFNLWEQKPSAIVRFDVSSPNDLEIVDVHNVKITRSDGKFDYRNVACLRSNDEPFKNCPLCANNIKTRRTNVFVKMLEYRVDESGKVNVVPVTWSRYATFADELVSLLNDYGDLREHLFKITRDTSSGKTKYVVRYQPEMGMYTEAAGYVKDFSAFNNFMINKHSYMERTFEELEEFVKTGVMASRKPKEESKNLDTLIENKQEESRIEKALDIQDSPNNVITFNDSEIKPLVEPTYVSAPVPSDDELPFKVNGQVTPSTVSQVESDNPTTVRRRKYDFSDQEPFTNPF